MLFITSLLIFFFLLIGSFVILTNNPVHSILGLVLIFFTSACLLIAVGLELFAALLLIIYVGAISVLFLFVVMLLNIRVLELNTSLVKYWWLGSLYSLFFLVMLYYTLFTSTIGLNFVGGAGNVSLPLQAQDWSAVGQLGEVLFLHLPHLLTFAALVLFVAIVSPVVLSYVSFSSIEHGNMDSTVRKQNLFVQGLRCSIEKHFA